MNGEERLIIERLFENQVSHPKKGVFSAAEIVLEPKTLQSLKGKIHSIAEGEAPCWCSWICNILKGISIWWHGAKSSAVLTHLIWSGKPADKIQDKPQPVPTINFQREGFLLQIDRGNTRSEIQEISKELGLINSELDMYAEQGLIYPLLIDPLNLRKQVLEEKLEVRNSNLVRIEGLLPILASKNSEAYLDAITEDIFPFDF